MTSVDLHPEFISKNGEREFAVIPYDEYKALCEYLEDVEDLRDLHEAIENDDGSPSLSLEEVEKELGLTS